MPACFIYPLFYRLAQDMGGPTLNDRAGVIYASPSAMHHPDGTMPKSPGDGYEYRSFILQSSANLTDKGFKRVKVEPNP